MENQIPSQPPLEKTNTTHPLILILLFFIFPPAAWIILFVQKRYHTVLTILLTISGFLYFLISVVVSFLVYPKISFLLLQSSRIDYAPATLQYFFLACMLLSSGTLFLFSLYLFRKMRNQQLLTKKQLIIAALLFVFATISIPTIIVFSILKPLYKITSDINTKIPKPSPTPISDPTTNWKTYTDTTNTYSMKYPNDWSVATDTTNVTFYPPRISQDIWQKIAKEAPVSEPFISIAIVNVPFSQSPGNKVSNMLVIKPKSIKIDNTTGYYYQEICAPSCGPTVDIPYEQGNKTLRINLLMLDKNNVDLINKRYHVSVTNTDEVTFQQMLQTFRFNTSTDTKSTDTISPSTTNPGFKTYINSAYGVSIDFPKSWHVATDNYFSDEKEYLIFSLYQNKNQRGGTRLELYKNFLGDFCSGGPSLTKSIITFNNGTTGEKYICNGMTTAASYTIGKDTYWLIAVMGDTTTSIDLFETMISSFRFE